MYRTDKLIDRVCETCRQSFKARPDQVKIGTGRFCSHRCKALAQPRETLSARLWKRVDKSGDCWIWRGYVNKDGYGIMSRGDGHLESTHRIAYRLTHGGISEGMQILHRCDNPPCCNPDHLFLGTQVDNITDMVAKHRNVAHRGERAPAAKLTQAQVDEIRKRFTGKRGERGILARDYGVCFQSICNILDGKTWRNS